MHTPSSSCCSLRIGSSRMKDTPKELFKRCENREIRHRKRRSDEKREKDEWRSVCE